MSQFLQPLAEGSWFKLFLAAILSLLTTHPQSVAILAILITIDLITGIFACFKTGQAFTSKKLGRTGQKVAVYILLLAAITVVGNGYPELLGWTISASYLYIAMTELVSITENVMRIRPETAAWIRPLLDRIRSSSGFPPTPPTTPTA
jgi:phage-related holin